MSRAPGHSGADRAPSRLPADDPGPEPSVSTSPDGVDDSLILWFLGLTPTERLQWAQEMADAVAELRGGRAI